MESESCLGTNVCGQSFYDECFKFGIEMTNVQVRLPSRAEDFDRFKRLKMRSIHIANDKIEKLRRTVEM